MSRQIEFLRKLSGLALETPAFCFRSIQTAAVLGQTAAVLLRLLRLGSMMIMNRFWDMEEGTESTGSGDRLPQPLQLVASASEASQQPRDPYGPKKQGEDALLSRSPNYLEGIPRTRLASMLEKLHSDLDPGYLSNLSQPGLLMLPCSLA